jgi:two-component system, chemotaxis family, sensor kinase CheA
MAKDPYRYFRVEAHELLDGLGRGLLELERSADAEAVKRLLRAAHTLKGASRVVKQIEIAELAHAIEDVLAPHREAKTPAVDRSEIDRLLSLVDSIRARLSRLDAPAEKPAPAPAVDEKLRSVRVSIDDLDAILADLSSLTEKTPALAALYDRIFEMRLIPSSAIADELERAVRDAARTLDKRVEFRATGVETRVDAHVLFALRGALVHAVQNAVAHGIDRSGTVSLAIERRGHRAAFTVTDDGRGLNLALIKKTAVERGLADEQTARAMSQKEAIALLLAGGLSTSRTVTKVSGRGLGLDAIRETVARLKGELELESAPGSGTRLVMIVPISLSSLPALAVEAGGSTALIPLDAVRGAVRVPANDVASTAEGDRALVDGRMMPFVSLARTLGHRGPQPRPKARTMVIVDAGGRQSAVEVDRLGAIRNVVVRSLPDHLAADPIVAGAAFDRDGLPQLLLSPAALTQHGRGALAEEPGAEPAKPCVLVIDDSLTTRMLEQSILESAGYRVDLAISAEEGLEKARSGKYGLFIVDVEMPGMDGFEFVSRTRADPTLHDVPAILVTSRADAVDKKRGDEVGARAYMVKSEFDQQALLATIRRLVG